MPKGTELQVGFLAPQSKHSYITSVYRPQGCGIPRQRNAHLVSRLCLELGKDILRLGLGRQSHGECLSDQTARRVSGVPSEKVEVVWRFDCPLPPGETTVPPQ